jgi:hypothetical protein
MRIKEMPALHPLIRIEGSFLWQAILRPLFLVSGAAALWALSLPGVDPRNMTDLGLVSVLPATYYAALALLTISFGLAVFQEATSTPILLLHMVLYIFMIHGTPQIVYGTLRYSWAWKHVGIIDYIQRHGAVDPTIGILNAYHNWPGFFALGALLTEASGFSSALSFAGWGPVFFNLIDLGALLLIFKALTDDRRLIWLSVWFFFLASWIGQDYFSPQAMTYFLYLVVLGIVLTWLRSKQMPARQSIKNWLRFDRVSGAVHSLLQRATPEAKTIASTTPAQRVGLMLVLIMIFFVIASSHQLTPLMLFSALSVLVIFQVTRERNLPILVAVITTAWIIYMTVGFLDANLAWVVQSIGSFGHNFNATLINLSKASAGQRFIAVMDRTLSASIWILAGLGLLRRLRSGSWDLPAMLLAVSPIPMLVLNSYGGEMLFRVYYFGLPFVAFFAASLLYPAMKNGHSWRTPVLTVGLSFFLLSSFLFAYYGKDRMYYFSPQEVAAANYLNQNAPKGALIVDGSWDWPLQYKNYEFYNYLSIASLSKNDRLKVMNDPVRVLSQWMDDIPTQDNVVAGGQKVYIPAPPSGTGDNDDYPAAYLIITKSQEAHIEMTGLMPAGSFVKIEKTLEHSGRFKVVFSNQDATILKLIDPQEGPSS